MPKRKHSDDTDESEFLAWKIRKLKKKLKRSRRSRNSSQPRDARTPTMSEDEPDEALSDYAKAIQSNEIPHNIDLIEEIVDSQSRNTAHSSSPANNVQIPILELENTAEPDPTTVTNEHAILKESSSEDLNPEVLEILGVDPSIVLEHGADIHKELASRFQHIATTGLTKESRKELCERYLIPANSVLIGAPCLNTEIKLAITETILKRDKGIEGRQKQLATAISGLSRVLTTELENPNKDSERLKQLMDVCRILCDIQHAESVIRRNFAIYSIKKELKDHLVDTKIDKYLFGENLAETLKSAKAVSKSSTDLKTKQTSKPKPFPMTANNLNWKSPAPARRPQRAPRGRDAAPPPAPGPSVRYNRNTAHANSSKTSQHPSRPTRFR